MPTIRPRDVDPETLAKILAASGVTDKLKKRKKPEPAKLVTPRFEYQGTFYIPFASVSESNGRDWHKRSARTQAARMAISKVFGKHLVSVAFYAANFHLGKTIKCRFVRLGGKMMDRSNLAACFKGCEDTVCMFLGMDDGDPRWIASFDQEPGGEVGVRIELEVMS